MQAAATVDASQRYAKAVEVSKRIRWDIDRDVIKGRTFDFTKNFLPDILSRADRVDNLSAAEKRLLSQIQGRTYANMFGLVERFIGAKLLEVSRDHWLGDQAALEALQNVECKLLYGNHDIYLALQWNKSKIPAMDSLMGSPAFFYKERLWVEHGHRFQPSNRDGYWLMFHGDLAEPPGPVVTSAVNYYPDLRKLGNTYDNSDKNPRNPDRPPRHVVFGQNSSDEMGDLWLQVVTATEADRTALFNGIRAKTLSEDANGYEMLVKANPDHAGYHNDLAFVSALLGRVDAVSIATPTPFHFEIASAFLESGAHVLVEKPITTTVEDARRLIEVAARARRILQVGHLERFNAGILALDGVLTVPRFIESHRLAPFKQRGTDVNVLGKACDRLFDDRNHRAS